MESRMLRYIDAELRASDNDDMVVGGYALKFDKPTRIGSGKYAFMEVISRSALDGTNLDDVVLTFNHSLDNVLARTKNGSLTLTRDAVGLLFEARIVDTAVGRDVYKLIRDGIITRMSYAATPKAGTSLWTVGGDGIEHRQITAFERFFDVSAVTFPAYEDTLIEARGASVADTEALRYLNHRAYLEQMDKLNKILGGKKA